MDVAFGSSVYIKIGDKRWKWKKNMIVDILFKYNLILKIWFNDQNHEIQVYVENVIIMPFNILLRWSYQFVNIARYPLNDTCKQYTK